MTTIAAILLTILFTYFTASVDAEHLNKKQYIYDHKYRFLQRLTFFLAFALVNPLYALASALLFTTLFDQTLNTLRGLKLYHLGTTSRWDRFFKQKPILYTLTKLLCFAISLILFNY
jgi:hypothetical protein